jgi:mRNA-degrading endonuclease RelE of RelBE toxin-antitoxin system
MTYDIIITKSIQKQLDNLPSNIQERVYTAYFISMRYKLKS